MPLTRPLLLALVGSAALLATRLPRAPSATAPGRLVVHEWGTFTSLLSKDGTALGGINTDDEPVPAFVHRIVEATGRSLLESPLTKGVRRGLPSVTMRLETPVLYFHTSDDRPGQVRVSAQFNGGWLTEYYPKADARIDGKPVPPGQDPGNLSASSGGSLRWDVTLNPVRAPEPPATRDSVWLAPRAVRAAELSTGRERERFLFYRGVGRLDPPLRIVRRDDQLELRPAVAVGREGRLARFPGGWLVSVRADGACAYRAVAPGEFATLPALSSVFPAVETARHDLDDLRKEMKGALIREGLFPDEAEALLRTWAASYFQSPGLRLFVLVPRAWTDAVLPLEVERSDGGPVDVLRVMVGRIELISAEQERLIAEIAAAKPAPDLKPVIEASERLRASRPERYKELASGRVDPEELGVPVPATYRAFLALGRFRVALLTDAAAREQSPPRRLSGFLSALPEHSR